MRPTLEVREKEMRKRFLLGEESLKVYIRLMKQLDFFGVRGDGHMILYRSPAGEYLHEFKLVGQGGEILATRLFNGPDAPDWTDGEVKWGKVYED
jgi:hypothetical protein